LEGGENPSCSVLGGASLDEVSGQFDVDWNNNPLISVEKE
jgi:hypothetical protein